MFCATIPVMVNRVPKTSSRMRIATALCAASVCAGCASVPPRPIPQHEAKSSLPGWYPEAPWTETAAAKEGDFLQGKVVFKTAKSDIAEPSSGVLAKLTDYLTANQDISQLRLEGHTDARGSEKYNQSLSEQRVIAVADWLVDQGVDHMRLIAVAFGESRPLGPNCSSAGRQENRRTEFHIAEVGGRRFLGKDPTNGGLVVRVKSKAERDAEAAMGKVPVAEEPPFNPTGNVIEPVKMPKLENLLKEETEPPEGGPADTLPEEPAPEAS